MKRTRIAGVDGHWPAPIATEFSELPCCEGRSAVRVIEVTGCCGAGSTIPVDVADCSILGGICTPDGKSLSGEKTLRCHECKFAKLRDKSC